MSNQTTSSLTRNLPFSLPTSWNPANFQIIEQKTNSNCTEADKYAEAVGGTTESGLIYSTSASYTTSPTATDGSIGVRITQGSAPRKIIIRNNTTNLILLNEQNANINQDYLVSGLAQGIYRLTLSDAGTAPFDTIFVIGSTSNALTIARGAYLIKRNPDGTLEIFIDDNGNKIPIDLHCGCCEKLIRELTIPQPAFFDIGTQTCRWALPPCDQPDDIFKIVLNSTGSDGSIFSEDTGEDCTLVIDFDYLFKFDCETLTKLISTTGGIGTCSDVVDLLESLKATVSIDVIDPTQPAGPTQLIEVFSDVIFPAIGAGNLYNYLRTNGDFTGFYICGKLLNQQPNDNTCYPLNIYNPNINGSQVNCSTFVNNLIPKLYQQAGLNPSIPANVVTFKSNVTENAFKSEWSRYRFEITDNNILDLIRNQKIKLNVKIEGNCIDSCIYFDNIKLEKNCTKIERRNIFISRTPGFDLDKIIDNKKSWVEIDEKTRRTFYIAKADNTEKIRHTDYYLFDSEQVINTKEIDLDINIASAIETDVWDFIYDNPCLLTGKTDTSTGATFPIVAKDAHGNDIILPMGTTIPITTCNELAGSSNEPRRFVPQAFITVANNIGEPSSNDDGHCKKRWIPNLPITPPLDEEFCICEERYKYSLTYECGYNFSIVKLRTPKLPLNPNLLLNNYVELWVTCEKSGDTSQNKFYYLEDYNGSVNISGVTLGDRCIQDFKDIRTFFLENGVYAPDLFQKNNEGNCIDCGCPKCDSDADFVDFDELFTLSLDTIDTLEDFKYYTTSQLIDAKNRKTISSYPTLKLLYERYLNSNKYCTNLSSQFTYEKMDQFADLIGNYWVDLVEQVIPATTIWGATRIYSNTIFDSQKFQYKTGSIIFGQQNQNNVINRIYPSPTVGVVPCGQGVTAFTTTIQGRLNQNTPVIGWENNTKYNKLYIVQYNAGSEFIGSVNIIGGGGAGPNQPPNIIVNCDIGVTIVGENPDISLSNGTATANVIGDVQQADIKYLWNDGSTGQTITNLSAGTYSVTVWDKDEPTCRAIDMITLIEV